MDVIEIEIVRLLLYHHRYFGPGIYQYFFVISTDSLVQLFK